MSRSYKMKKVIDLNMQCNTIKRLIANFEKELRSKNLRNKVVALVPILRELRKLGKNLIPAQIAASARDRILHYFRKYPHIIISGDELFVISGIQEYARRVRELRVQFGWAIINGVTAKAMAKEGEFPNSSINISKMGPDDYILLSEREDKEAAYRWNVANEIRRQKSGVRDKILGYFLKNIGKNISGEELRYLAKDRSEWARRVRELRTEFGWPISTRNTGRPDLDVGVYVMESKRQSPEHDRQIPDPIRGTVLRRDGYKCKVCLWSHKEWNPSDPRHLELHHIKEHVKGGSNTENNLMTVCTICHDDIHRRK